jgi:hypothetical protein
MHGLGAGVEGGDLWVDLLIVVLCILLSAFFAGSETALTAASHGRMHTLEKEGDRRAAAVNRLLRQRNRMIAALLLGNTLVTIGSSAFTTSVLNSLVGENGAVARVCGSVAQDARHQLSRRHVAARGENHHALRLGFWPGTCGGGVHRAHGA